MTNANDVFTESSPDRYSHMLRDHDAGAMNAFRGANTRAENLSMNAKLLAYLIDKGYSVTLVKGTYKGDLGAENAKGNSDEIFLIIDHRDSAALKDDLIKLGRLYDQDAILWIPKGEGASLIGTTKLDVVYIRDEHAKGFGGSEFGEASRAFFSRILGSQVACAGDIKFLLYECQYPGTINGIRGMKIAAAEIEAQLSPLLVNSQQ